VSRDEAGIIPMSVKITNDTHAPTATVELPIMKPLADYDIEEVEMPIPRAVDGILVTQGFKDLMDDARGNLQDMLSDKGLEIVQLTGAICPDGEIYRPGIWIVLRETGAAANQAMSAATQASVATIAEELRKRFGLS
jgi:hypothetical protein